MADESRELILEQYMTALEMHVKEWPHLGDCEWNCTTAGPLHELIAKVRLAALEEAAQLADKECWPYHSVFADKIRSLAAVGIGQAVSKVGETVTVPGCWDLLRNEPCRGKLLSSGKVSRDCEQDEEKCPLGHCQKPSVIKLQSAVEVQCFRYNSHGEIVDTGEPCIVPAPPAVTQHVCSTCRVVYVPTIGAK